MTNWKSLQVNKQNIECQTDKAVLFNCPHKSAFNGYSFWHTTKLVREGKHSAAVSLSYRDDFVFKLKKYGKGKYNSHNAIDEREIGVSEFEEMFNVINENITAPTVKNPYETHKPQALQISKAEVLEELKDE